jgi:hypothetical protein
MSDEKRVVGWIDCSVGRGYWDEIMESATTRMTMAEQGRIR